MRDLTTAEQRTVEMDKAQAIGYVWGLQDAGADSAGDTLRSLAFGEAYAERKRAYLGEGSYWMPNIRDAFDWWSRLGEIPLNHDRLRELERMHAQLKEDA